MRPDPIAGTAPGGTGTAIAASPAAAPVMAAGETAFGGERVANSIRHPRPSIPDGKETAGSPVTSGPVSRLVRTVGSGSD